MTRRQLFTLCFFAAFALLLSQIGLIFRPFLLPVLWALILAHLVMPLHVRLTGLLGGRASASAALLTAAIMALGVVPVAVLSLMLVREAGGAYAAMDEWIQAGGVQRLMAELRAGSVAGIGIPAPLARAALEEDKLEAFLLQSAKSLSEFVMEEVAGFVTNAFRLGADFLVMIFTLFFLFRDGPRLYESVYRVIPLEDSHKERILTRLDQTLRAVVKGVLLTAVVQGLLAGAAYGVLDVPFPGFLTAVTMALAPLPFGGTALVWVPVALYLYWAAPLWQALAMVAWGVGVVTLADNILKPMLIGKEAQIPVLALFFSVLGGLAVYGVIGMFLGPIFVALLLTAVQIYQDEYLPRDEPLPPKA